MRSVRIASNKRPLAPAVVAESVTRRGEGRNESCRRVVTGAEPVAYIVGTEVGHERAQHLGERRERNHGFVQLHAVPDQHTRARVAGERGPLVDEPAFPDPRLTDDDERMRRAARDRRERVP